ncbi:MAG: hypothetical protein ABIQ39_05700 [Ilumatobacteraceae bacterium]
MSHDRWRYQLREAGKDSALLVVFLRSGVPSDGLQLAGSVTLARPSSADLGEIIESLAVQLAERRWLGDIELADPLIDHLNGRASDLIPIAVNLEDLADVIDQPQSSESYIDLESGVVWPGELFDVGQEPDGFDSDDADRWLLVRGEGSRAPYRDMERFILTVEPVALRDRLQVAISGKAPFKTFLATLQRDDDHFTVWHRYRDDARLGRARHWLADNGYTSGTS